MTGDCDDYTALLGALLESIGYPVDVKIVARNGRETFHHVYPVVHLDGLEVALDASMPVPFGTQATDLGKQRVYRSELNGMRVKDVYGGSRLRGVSGLGYQKVTTGDVSSQVQALIDRYVNLMRERQQLCAMSPAEFEAGFQRVGGVTLAQMPRETRSVIFRRLNERFVLEQSRCKLAPGVIVPPVVAPDPYKEKRVGECSGIQWPEMVLQPGKTLTDQCIRERIALGKIKAASGCRLEVTPTVDPGIHTVISIPVRPTGFIPPPGIPGEDIPPEGPVPSGVAKCDWPHGRGPSVLQVGEVISGHCVKLWLDMGLYRPAQGCSLVYQGPEDPTRLPGPVGRVTCVRVGFDQPPTDRLSPEGDFPPYKEDRPYLPGVQPTVVTVPGAGYPEVKEAGFPTWAIIAIGAAVLLPMLLAKGK